MFSQDNLYITAIHSVVYIHGDPVTTPRHSKYGPTLFRYELIYKISGETLTFYDGKKLYFSAGSVEFLPKKEWVDYHVERLAYGDCIDIHFDTDCPLPDEAITEDFSDNKILRPLFERIYRLWVQKQEGYYPRCMALFYEILAELQKASACYLPADTTRKISPGVEYLHAHYCDKALDYAHPAQLCGISYTYFKRIFLQKYGIPPLHYVTRLRMERARELLSTGQYRIGEIATLCGYDNVYYFSNAFKKHFGVAPKFYREKE